MAETRKRHRSNEDESGVQMKYFVNQSLIDKHDEKLMSGIYEKTINMLMSANIKLQSQQKTEEINNTIDIIDDKLTEAQGCMLCWRNVIDSSNFLCKNCNLKVCQICRSSCSGCLSNLCSNCVTIFGCSIGDHPICEDCKIYVN